MSRPRSATQVASPLVGPDTESHAFSSPEDARPETEQRTILLIEDDFATRQTIAALLTEEGFRVVCAANGAEAFGLLQSSVLKASVIILDIWMPYMDGLEFRALQRSLPSARDIPVVVVTAGGFRPEEAEGLGLSCVLRKPLHESMLLEAVRQLATGKV